ncbi:MAG TPA: hypothetical protein VKG38_06195 [Solirubrobacteraceae bacterium]|nr:hypothetical protein [Solirubrobacteraceae bacterium]
MPQSKTQRRAPATKAAATKKRPAKARRAAATKSAAAHKGPARKAKQSAGAVDRGTELSGEVFKSLESGQRAAIDAVRKFVDTVDEKLPARGERPSGRQEVIDAAMEMADRLVHTQYDFLRNVVQSAGKALSRPDSGKK